MKLSLSQAAEVRLGRQRAPQYQDGEHLVPYLRSANITDGRLDLTDVKSMNFTPEEQVIFQLREGDVLVTEGSGSRDTVGASAVWRNEIDPPVCFQNTLLRLRPREGLTDGGYLAWWARHAHGSGQIAAVSSGANILHIGSDGLKRLDLRLPDLPTQRRIADFLDDRVTRIDRIVAARRKQVDEVDATVWAQFSRRLERSGADWAPLRRAVASIADGPFGSAFSSSDYVDSGPAVIRLGNIGFAEFRARAIARIPGEIFDRFPNAHVRPGDLLIASLGDARNHAGRACLAPRGLGPAMVKGKCFVARTANNVADPSYLAALLSSPVGAEQLVAQGTGATRSMLNFDRLLSTRLPLPDLPEQRRIADAFATERHDARRFSAELTRSADLLTEYKASLITAAVTGELDVTTASSGIPG